MSSTTSPTPAQRQTLKTSIINVAHGSKPKQEDVPSPFGHWAKPSKPTQEEKDLTTSHLNTWSTPQPSPANFATLIPLQQAADYLLKSDVPLAFPTETVYGLGADATRSAAVKGIYTAKGRPSDNPLIVHVADLDMLRDLLAPSQSSSQASSSSEDSIPEIYHALINKFWPGPLTILLPNPSHPENAQSTGAEKPKMALAPEVTAGLPTFGARMPSSALARSLIKLANRPLAAPSANASTKPSPTTAQHVFDDLNGRIEFILDGGACTVGVESTVVDGLCDPPVVLRPGGVSIEELRSVKGWERVEKAYQDAAMNIGGEKGGDVAPRAPGMKYKHYSPRAKVILYEASTLSKFDEQGGGQILKKEDLDMALQQVPQLERGEGQETQQTIAVIRTSGWPVAAGLPTTPTAALSNGNGNVHGGNSNDMPFRVTELELSQARGAKQQVKILDVNLGSDIRGVAHGLFAALRELDRRGADVIFVEGVSDADGQDIAAAVMNRLRKAASVIR